MLWENGFSVDALSTFDLSTEDVARRYQEVGRESRSPAERDAANNLVQASEHLNEERCERASISAQEAVERFKELEHSQGLADARRFLIHAYCCQIAHLRLSAEGDSLRYGVRDTLQKAERLAVDQAAEYKSSGNVYGEASLRFALAEVKLSSLNAKSRVEVEDVLTDALRLAREAQDLHLQGCIFLLLGRVASKAGAAIQAEQHAKSAQIAFQKIGDTQGEAMSLHLLGVSLFLKGHLEDGVDKCLEAAQLLRKNSRKKAEACIYLVVSQFYMSRSQGRESAEYAEDAFSIFRSLGSTLEVHAAFQLCKAFILQSEYRAALLLTEEVLGSSHLRYNRRAQAILLAAKALVYTSKEDFTLALAAADEAQNLIQDIRDPRLEGALLSQTAGSHLARKQFEDAAQSASEAVTAYQAAGDRFGEASAMDVLFEVRLRKEDFYAATQVANEQRAIFQEFGFRGLEGLALLAAASALSKDENFDQAQSFAEEALELFQDLGDGIGEVKALGVLAEIFKQREESDTAIEKAQDMRAKARELCDSLLEAEACKTLASIHRSFDHVVEAVRAANEAVAMAKKTAHKNSIVEVMMLVTDINVALILRDGAQVSSRGAEKALRPAREALTVAKATGKKSLISSCTYQLAEVQLMSYKLGQAMISAKEAIDIFRELQDASGEAGAVILMGETHYAGGRHDKAEETTKDGLRLAQACGERSKEQYATQLLERIKESRRVVLQPVVHQMVPMQMMPIGGTQQESSPASAQEAAVSPAPKQVGLDPALVQQTVQEMARQAIGVDDELYLDSALMDSGMDSLTAVSFRNGLQQTLGVKLPSSLMFDYPTMKEVAGRIVELSIENA